MKIVQGLIGKLETFPFEDHVDDDVLEGCVLQNYNLSLCISSLKNDWIWIKHRESIYVSIFHSIRGRDKFSLVALHFVIKNESNNRNLLPLNLIL